MRRGWLPGPPPRSSRHAQVACTPPRTGPAHLAPPVCLLPPSHALSPPLPPLPEPHLIPVGAGQLPSAGPRATSRGPQSSVRCHFVEATLPQGTVPIIKCCRSWPCGLQVSTAMARPSRQVLPRVRCHHPFLLLHILPGGSGEKGPQGRPGMLSQVVGGSGHVLVCLEGQELSPRASSAGVQP